MYNSCCILLIHRRGQQSPNSDLCDVLDQPIGHPQCHLKNIKSWAEQFCKFEIWPCSVFTQNWHLSMPTDVLGIVVVLVPSPGPWTKHIQRYDTAQGAWTSPTRCRQAAVPVLGQQDWNGSPEGHKSCLQSPPKMLCGDYFLNCFLSCCVYVSCFVVDFVGKTAQYQGRLNKPRITFQVCLYNSCLKQSID